MNSAGISAVSGGVPFITGFSPHVRLLNSLEQTGLYNAANFQHDCFCDSNTCGGAATPYGTAANLTLSLTKLSVFLCPSCPVATWLMGGAGPILTYTATGNNYFACLGSTLEFDGTQTGGPPNGLFQFSGQAIGVHDTTDGTSNTIAFGEWLLGDGNNNLYTPATDFLWVGQFPQGVTRNTPQMSLPAGNPAPQYPFLSWAKLCASSVAVAADRGGKTAFAAELWTPGYRGLTWGTVCLPPNQPSGPNCIAATSELQNPGMCSFASYHPGGANAAFADGSVHFIKNSIAINVLWTLGSRAQGEIVSSDSY